VPAVGLEIIGKRLSVRFVCLPMAKSLREDMINGRTALDRELFQ
jgi:hypothetical protein